MPWRPHYDEADARAAIQSAASWRDVLKALDYRCHGKSIETVRRWAARWGVSTAHLTDRRGVRRGLIGYSDAELRAAVVASRSWAETLRRLGYCPSGGNWKTLKARAAELGISIDHFDPYASTRERIRRERTPLASILIEGSTYSGGCLKQRLYESGLKQRRCELCGQDENWRGKTMGLILDHTNGVRDDHRLENLRIVCPNCAATLDTHCGRKNRAPLERLDCLRCRTTFTPKYRTQRYCSRECGSRWNRQGLGRPGARKVERPPPAQLLSEVKALGYLAVGRKYGVSDNAVRKWLRDYGVMEIPKRTWPNRRDRDAVAA